MNYIRIILIIVICCFSLTAEKSNAQDAKFYLKRAKKFYKVDNYIDAIKDLQHANQLDPKLFDPVYLLGQYFETINKIDSAIKYFEIAKTMSGRYINKESIYIRDHLGNIYIKRKECDKAETIYELFYDEINYQSFYYLSKCYYSENEYKKALSYCLLIDKSAFYNNYKDSISLIQAYCYDSLSNTNIDSTRYLYLKTAFNFYQTFLAKKYRGVFSSYYSSYNLNKDDEKYFRRMAELSEITNPYPLFEERYYSLAINANPLNPLNYYSRSISRYKQNKTKEAFEDIDKAINIDNRGPFYCFRGVLNTYVGNFDNAFEDFNSALQKNNNDSLTYAQRGICWMKKLNYKSALADFKSANNFYPKGNHYLDSLIQEGKNKIYDSERESIPPVITIKSTLKNDPPTFLVQLNSISIPIKGKIIDDSRIKSINCGLIQGKFDSSIFNPEFEIAIPIKNETEIALSATDIYDNINTIKIKIERFKSANEKIIIKSPPSFEDGNLSEIYPTQSSNSLLVLEGEIQNITWFDGFKVFANKQPIGYEITDEGNIHFLDSISIPNGQDSLSLSYTSGNTNTNIKTYYINRADAQFSSSSLMGRTWVVFISNYNYKYWNSLDGPKEDFKKVNEALSKYSINKIIVKENLSEDSMKYFFKKDLRNRLKKAKVNSLLIWYAGHGDFKNYEDDAESGESYWIPVDSKRTDEDQYYAISELRNEIKGYNLKHLLIVSDACKTGAAFTEKDRGGTKITDCSEANADAYKSYQSLTSSGKENANDNSLLAETFADALVAYSRNHTCISVNKIRDMIINRTQINQPKPELNYIRDLTSDKNSTFFFIPK